ncbi:MAG: hypothetical protein V2I35_13875 [Desulfocapsaceae bacterium]|jgi:hypothetical protein|nr:hypothetical protein [Desulfocapsaceae bacterium]
MLEHRLKNYAVDLLNNQQIRGWVFNKLRTRQPVHLKFYLDKVFIGETVADTIRKDLKDQRIHPDGRCGFHFQFPSDTDFSRYSQLRIFTGGSKPLCTFATEAIPDVFSSDPPRIFFMHIPKTAGTSFNGFIRQRYPADTTAIHIESIPSSGYPDLIKQKRYLAGHFRIETIKQHFDLNLFSLFTILRRPQAHLHSNLNWLRGIAAHPENKHFLDHPDHIQALGLKLNHSKNSIGDILGSLVSNLKGLEIEMFDNRQTRHFLDYKPERVTEKDLQQALENLKLFSGIGLTEAYEPFVKQFCNTYNLRFIKQVVPLNTSKYRPLYNVNDSGMHDILRPLIEYDLRLYETARQLIYKQLYHG